MLSGHYGPGIAVRWSNRMGRPCRGFLFGGLAVGGTRIMWIRGLDWWASGGLAFYKIYYDMTVAHEQPTQFHNQTNIKIKQQWWQWYNTSEREEYRWQRSKTYTNYADQCIWMSRGNDDHILLCRRRILSNVGFGAALADCRSSNIYCYFLCTCLVWVTIIRYRNLLGWWFLGSK